MDKPSILYHASPHKRISVIEARNKTVRNLDEGPVVFATPYIDYASCFIVNTDDNWTRISKFGQLGNFWNIIISDKQRFINLDKGGAIYELPPDTFYRDKTKGTIESEWVSKIPVKPIKKRIYESGLKAMLINGVHVFFVSKEVFKQIKNSSDHGFSIIKRLQPYTGEK